jgi:hypothetical protein
VATPFILDYAIPDGPCNPSGLILFLVPWIALLGTSIPSGLAILLLFAGVFIINPLAVFGLGYFFGVLVQKRQKKLQILD